MTLNGVIFAVGSSIPPAGEPRSTGVAAYVSPTCMRVKAPLYQASVGATSMPQTNSPFLGW